MKRSSLGLQGVPRHSALVLIDIQNDFCAPGGAAVDHAERLDCLEHAVVNSAALVDHARAAGIPRIFVRSVMDNKYKLPKTLDRHRRLGLKREICQEGTWGSEFYRIQPARDECIVTKHTNDAFLYTFLEPLLRKLRARTLIVCGFYTELCVEDTVRAAIQRGFHVVIPEECTAGLSLACMRMSLLNMAAFQVDVVALHRLTGGSCARPEPHPADGLRSRSGAASCQTKLTLSGYQSVKLEG